MILERVQKLSQKKESQCGKELNYNDNLCAILKRKNRIFNLTKIFIYENITIKLKTEK